MMELTPGMTARRAPPKRPALVVSTDKPKSIAPKAKPSVANAAKTEAAVKALQELFGQNLAHARQGAGLSQRALSRMTGISQRHISAIEIGSVNPSLATIVELSLSVGRSPIEMLTPQSL